MLIPWIIQIIFNILVFNNKYEKSFIFIMLLLSLIGNILQLLTLPSLIFWIIKLSSSYKIDNSSR